MIKYLSNFLFYLLIIACTVFSSIAMGQDYNEPQSDDTLKDVFDGVKSILDGVYSGIEEVEQRADRRRREQYEEVAKMKPPSRSEYYYIMGPQEMQLLVMKAQALKIGTDPIKAVEKLGFAPTKVYMRNNLLHQYYTVAQYDQKESKNSYNIYITLVYSQDYRLQYIRSNIRGVTNDKKYSDEIMMGTYGQPRWLLEDLLPPHNNNDLMEL